MSPLEELWTTAEVMAALKVSENTVRRWATDGVLPAVKIGPRAVRFRRSDVDALLAPKVKR
jgi:excisionase family DNA binding protein